jgi:hypothetical protein
VSGMLLAPGKEAMGTVDRVGQSSRSLLSRQVMGAAGIRNRQTIFFGAEGLGQGWGLGPLLGSQ